MPGGRFFDTNVLLYLADDGSKFDAAVDAMAHGGTISVQVLNEMAAVLGGHKFRWDWPKIEEFIDRHRSFLFVVPVTESVHLRGRAIAERHRVSVYDGMILGAALEAGCDELLTEDLHDGLVIEERLTIRNPFA